MKRKLHQNVILRLLCVVLCSLMLLSASALAANQDDSGTVSVQFTQSDVSFQLYYAASKTERGYQATELFQSYSINFTNTSTEDLRTLATTLYACVVQAQLSPALEKTTDTAGSVTFSGLEPGLYLLTSTEHTVPIAVAVSAGKTVTVVPKIEPTPDPDPQPEAETISVDVVKIWADEDNPSARPNAITVQLFQDNKLYASVSLSETTNWKHTWENLPADHSYLVIEKAVPEHYCMSIAQEKHAFILTNTLKDTEALAASEKPGSDTTVSKLPQTGQLWWPVSILAGAGLLALIIGMIKHKRGTDEA